MTWGTTMDDNDPDDLAFFRGLMFAVPIGLVMWALIAWGIWEMCAEGE